jgi:hypothetical protein
MLHALNLLGNEKAGLGVLRPSHCGSVLGETGVRGEVGGESW